MGKVVEDLKKRIWHMVEAFTSCKCYKDGEEEPKMIQSSEAEKISIQQRGACGSKLQRVQPGRACLKVPLLKPADLI
ncbi:hypothetical protein V6N11_014531 [Hibiscus sabdariffa]|uniref:Uncharacterized protein n=1 Tax=Hibiscus sabdariffa TaxID=183260 RepID=A0ABR2TPB7_9ROSI